MNFITNKMGWPSEYTRGYQIAEALGCKVNAHIEKLSDVVIAVKCYIDVPGMDNLYMDLIDSANTVQLAKERPNVALIAITDIMRDYLVEQVDNKIVAIPEHTCNFKREKRCRNKVKVVGYVGSTQCFDLDVEIVKKALRHFGLEFKWLICETDSVTREDVCEFYKTIDIQLAFRMPANAVRPPIYRNPLKIFNAGSFGIPTVAYPELAYTLCAGTYFLEAIDLDSVIDKCSMLKEDKCLYDFYAKRVYDWSQQFDIEKVAKRYAALSPDETFDIETNVEVMRRK